jgi:hypothetical protein
MLSRHHLMWEHMPPGGIRAREQTCSFDGYVGEHCSPDLSPMMNFLIKTAKLLLPITYMAPGEASAPLKYALLPGTGLPMYSSCSPLRPARAVLPSTGCL